MFRLFYLGLLGLMLGACVTPPRPVDELSHQRWNQRIEQLSPLQDWQMSGRVAMFVNDEVYHLGLRWRRQGPESTMSFEASLGQGLIQLEKNSTGVELVTTEGKRFSGSNAQQVIYDATGLTIPVEGLESWIKGIPAKTSNYRHEIDGEGRAVNLSQNDWFINYLEYEPIDLPGLAATDLPRRMYLKHEKLALKVILDQWHNNPPPADQGSLFPDFPR